MNNWNASLKIVSQLLFFLLLNTFLYNYHFRIGINLYLSDFLTMALLALTLLRWWNEFPSLPYRPWMRLFLILFFYYLVLALYAYVLLGNSPNAVMGRFRNLFFYPLLFFSGLTFTTTPDDMKKYIYFVRVHVLVSVMLGALSLKYPALKPAKIYIEGEIVEAQYFMMVTHGTALLCCWLFIYELFHLAQKNNAQSLFFLGISAVGILGTQNRSILVTFIIMIGLAFFYSRKAEIPIRKRMRMYLAGLLILLVGAGFFMVQSPYYEKFKKRIRQTIEAFSGKKEFFNTNPGIRVGRTIAAYKEWLKSPVFGCGWGNQITEFKIYDWQGHYVRSNYGTPHNYYITILYQVGIIGFLIMMYFFYLVYKRIKPPGPLHRENIMAYAFFIFYIGFMVFNIANTHFYGDPVFIPVFFFWLGAPIATNIATKTQRHEGTWPKKLLVS